MFDIVVFSFFFFSLLGAVQINFRGPGVDGGVALFFHLGELKVAPSSKETELRARGVMSEARGKIR
jgi:hypothetical protein